MEPQMRFEEKQYLGFNSYSIAFRMTLAIFCFVAFYYTEDRMRNADLLFLLGIIILVLSIILLFVKYIKITVDEELFTIRGMWKYQVLSVPLKEIRSVEKTIYSRYHLNNPAFNVHNANFVKFYTSGSDAVKIKLESGTELLVGTHKAEELFRLLKDAKPG
jgi:hypothetical protein